MALALAWELEGWLLGLGALVLAALVLAALVLALEQASALAEVVAELDLSVPPGGGRLFQFGPGWHRCRPRLELVIPLGLPMR